jgi:tetratricopeptide (TPR) repeat protein
MQPRRPSLAAALFLCGLALSLRLPALPALEPRIALEQAALLYQHGSLEEALARLQGWEAPAGDPAGAFQAELLRGLAYLGLGRGGEAVPPLQRALRLRPQDLDALLDLALAFQSSGRLEEAASVFQQARAAHPKSAQALLGLGSLAAARSRWPEAEAQARAALALAPNEPAAWNALADALVQQGRLRESIAAREKSLSLRPDKDLQFKQAVAWYSLGDWDKSAAALAKAKAGDKPEAYLLEGDLAQRRGDLAGAERRYLAALDARPGYSEARLNLGITYYDQQDYARALAQFRQIGPRDTGAAQARDYLRQTVEASVDQALRQGSDAVLAGDYPGAVQHWEAARDLAADKAPVEEMLASLRKQQGPRAAVLAAEGNAAFKAGRLSEALQAWRDALRIDPASPDANAGLKAAAADLARLKAATEEAGRQRLAQGDLSSARVFAADLDKVAHGAGDDLRRAVAKAEADQVAEQEALAKAALAQDKPEEALSAYDQALAVVPGDLRLMAKRGEAQAAVQRKQGLLLARGHEEEAGGKLKQAYDTVRAALALQPDDLEARQALARLSKRLDLRQLSPRAVDDLYYRGVYLYGNGQTADALVLWKQGLEAAPGHQPLRQAVRQAEAKLKALAKLEAKP